MLLVRTTVDIPDPLYRELKAKAATERRSVRELVLRAVRVDLQPSQKAKPRKAPVIKSESPGSLQLDNDKIFKIILFPDLNV